MRLPELLKDLVAFLVTQGHSIKKKKVPITNNYWVPWSNYWVLLGTFGRKRYNFSMESKSIMDSRVGLWPAVNYRGRLWIGQIIESLFPPCNRLGEVEKDCVFETPILKVLTYMNISRHIFCFVYSLNKLNN